MFCTRELSTYTSTSSAMVNTRYSELTTYSSGVAAVTNAAAKVMSRPAAIQR